MNKTAIDMLIESIEEDIDRTKDPTMKNFLGATTQVRRLQDYHNRLHQAIFYKRRAEELYG